MSEKQEYEYLGQLSTGANRIAYRPMIQIRISMNGQTSLQMAMLDSGSDITTMDSDIAEVLGIERSKCEHVYVSGVTGRGNGFAAVVNLEIEGFEDSIEQRVVFVDSLATGILLGQDGFFEKFLICFDRKNKKFSLTKN